MIMLIFFIINTRNNLPTNAWPFLQHKLAESEKFLRWNVVRSLLSVSRLVFHILGGSEGVCWLALEYVIVVALCVFSLSLAWPERNFLSKKAVTSGHGYHHSAIPQLAHRTEMYVKFVNSSILLFLIYLSINLVFSF